MSLIDQTMLIVKKNNKKINKEGHKKVFVDVIFFSYRSRARLDSLLTGCNVL